MNSLDIRNLYLAYASVYEDKQNLNEDITELYKGKHGQSESEYQADRSDAGKRISGDDKEGPASYTSRMYKKSATTAPGEKPKNTPKATASEKNYARLRHSSVSGKDYNKVGGPKGLPEEVDVYDLVLGHLLDEGYCDNEEAAEVIMTNMSEEWLEGILEAAKDQSDKQLDRAMKTTYKAQNAIDNRHQGRLGSKFGALPKGERDLKLKGMDSRLKSRRSDVSSEQHKRQDERVAKLKQLLGL